MPLAPESSKILENVKQSGKPCRFVLLSKGSKVLNVVAYRMGGQDSKIKEAKEAGTGEVACGVVDGKGTNISFKLLRSDGYESPPVKHTVLKDFLNEGTKLNVKPSIDIVDVLPGVEVEGSNQPQTAPYRTGDEWKAAIATIQQTKDAEQRATLLAQAARDFNTENQRVTTDLATTPDSQAALAQQETLRKISAILKVLAGGPPQRPLPETPGQQQPQQQQVPQQRVPQMPPLPMPPVPLTPPARRRQEQLAAAQPARKMVLQASRAAADCKEKPFADADLVQLAADAQQAAEKTRLGVHKDKTLPAILDLLKAANDLATHGRFADAHKRLADAQGLWTTGRAEQAKERKGAILDATKKIHDDRLTEYDKIEPILNAALAKIGAAASELTHVGNELCKSVRTMLADYQKGTIEALNPHVVGSLEAFLQSPGIPDTIAAVGQKLVQGARQALKSQFDKRQGTAGTRQAKAELLLELVPTKGADGGTSGTSEVQLVRSFEKNVVFAFKPLDGESNQNDGDTLREVLTSAMCKRFGELTNLDLGFPEISVANIGGRSGALIEGLNGFEMPVEKSEHLSPEEKAKLDQYAQNLPAKELQKVLLSAVVSGDGDLKWDNVFLGSDGGSARRFDGGKGFPDQKGRAEIFLGEIQGNTKIASPKECLLLNSPYSKAPLPGAKAPMSPDLVQGFLKIKDHLDELKTSMKKQAQEACKNLSTTDKPQQLDDKTIDQTSRSIEAAIKILEARPQITTEEFYTSYMSQRVLDMAEDFLSGQQAAIDSYDPKVAAQRLQEKKFNVDPDINIPVSRIKAIIQGGPQNYDDAVHNKELQAQFRLIDMLVAVHKFTTVDPQSIDVGVWRKSTKVGVPAPLDPAKCTALTWSALAKLSAKELLALVEKSALPDGKMHLLIDRIPLPGEYPTIDFTKANPDREPWVALSGSMKVFIPCKGKEVVKMPTPDELATAFRNMK